MFSYLLSRYLMLGENNNVRYEIGAISRPVDNMILYPASQEMYFQCNVRQHDDSSYHSREKQSRRQFVY